MIRKLSVLVGLLLILAVGALPAGAITWGNPDGNDHPNVGAVVVDVPDGDQAYIMCSGTLVHEQVFLTAGHCTDYFEYLIAAGVVSLDDFFVSFSPDNALDEATWLPVTEIITHPKYNWGPTSNPHDVGAMILEEPVTDIEPATLPQPFFLDDLKKAGELRRGSKGAKFTVVGYGSMLEWPPPEIVEPDGQRWRAQSEYLKLLKAWLLMSQNQAIGDGGTCFGDSGGPAFWTDPETDEETLVGITSWGDAQCVATGFDYRVDIPDTLDFIESVTPYPA